MRKIFRTSALCTAPAFGLLLLLTLTSLPNTLLAQNNSASSTAAGARILHPADLTNLMPATVFFRGLSATVQMRNTAGVKFPDGMFVLTGLVDTSGYSTAVRQKYQAYFINEVPLDIQGHALKPGAYGVGFVENNRFIVMDIGAHDLFTVGSVHDLKLKGARPLQILADAAPNRYRLYGGRDYIVFSRADGQGTSH